MKGDLYNIEPYYKTDKCKLYQGNCLEVMEQLETKLIKLNFTDLPYGTTAPEWDKIIPMQPLWKEYKRVLSNDGTVALFASQPFTTQLINSNLNNFRYCWYWIKNQGTNFHHAKIMPIRKIEEICIFYKGDYHPQMLHNQPPTNSAKGCSNGRTYFGTNKRDYKGGSTDRYPTNILEFKCVDNYHRLHSAQKPVELLEYIIKTYTNEGDIVLDSCMGSGSTGVACMNINRKFIGIEKEQKYCDIAKDRINKSIN